MRAVVVPAADDAHGGDDPCDLCEICGGTERSVIVVGGREFEGECWRCVQGFDEVPEREDFYGE
jgi:hypothetical protein